MANKLLLSAFAGNVYTLLLTTILNVLSIALCSSLHNSDTGAKSLWGRQQCLSLGSLFLSVIATCRGKNLFWTFFSCSPGIFSVLQLALAAAGGHLCRGELLRAGKSPWPSMQAGRCLMRASLPSSKTPHLQYVAWKSSASSPFTLSYCKLLKTLSELLSDRQIIV